MKKIIFLLLISFILLSCQKEDSPSNDILDKLRALTGIVVTEIQPHYNFPRAFQIDITQPVDQQNPAGPKFSQRIYLHHIDESLPMIMRTSGYTTTAKQVSELAAHINSNHMSVTHRYFWDAEPTPKDWQYLNIQQAAADHHRIVSLFKEIYKSKWITTGHSKGGMTAMFHRRFYPNDVNVTVAYVAPIMLGLPDLRFNEYLQNKAGNKNCRQKIKAFQRMALENRDALIEHLKIYAKQNGLKFSIGYGAAVEYSILEFWFYFFQYGSADCDKIPVEGASPDEIFNYLSKNSGFYYYTDRDKERHETYYYQIFTELGYYMFIVDHLEDLLVLVTDSSRRMLTPDNISMNYEPQVMRDILNWLQNEGDYIIYIYGGQDPYTIAGVEPSAQTNSLKIVQPGADHGVKIPDLDQKELVFSTLEDWLGISIHRQVIRQIQREPVRPRPPLSN